MKNPVRDFLEKQSMTTNSLARETGMNQPTIYRHVHYSIPMTFASMENYYRAGIPWNQLIAWNQYLLYGEVEESTD